ncbi:MAG: hypothetical protein ACXWC8_16865, partial [Limisphaerales bacterium]
AKVVLIERSLSCFYFGVVGLIPFLGIPHAIRALQQYWRVKRDINGMWNPARTYLNWGITCARISIAVFVIVVGSIILLVSYDSIFFRSGSQ